MQFIDDRRKTLLRLGTMMFLVSCCSSLCAQSTAVMEEAGFDQNLGQDLPLDLSFVDENGQAVQLGDYFNDKPVILTPVYYKCPMLCGLELNGLTRALRAMKMTVGEDFEIVTFTIDPKETSTLAGKKQKQYVAQYGRDAASHGWHFLTGDADSIEQLCDSIGFRAVYNEQTGEYAHAAGIVVCTPRGIVSRYLYGVEFAQRDIRLALLESGKGEVGTLTDQVMMFCYMYDPTTGKYGLAILNLVRVAGVITVLAMAVGITTMLRHERQQHDTAVLGEGDQHA